MNYIYDITLNFNDDLIEYYEWEKYDKIINIKKIPVFKLSKNDYFEIKNKNITFDNDFKHNIFLIAFDEEVIGIKVNKKGKIMKSHLTIDEELDVLRIIKKINTTKLKYTKISDLNSNPYLTRKEKERMKIIINKLDKIYKKNEYDKLSYLYLECFNKKEENINLMFSNLKKELMNNFEISNKILDLLVLFKQK